MADKKKVTGDYGSDRDAGYADLGYQPDKKPRYPLKEHGKWSQQRIRAAWSYINHKDNAAKYDKDEVRAIKERIKRAAKRHGVEISED